MNRAVIVSDELPEGKGLVNRAHATSFENNWKDLRVFGSVNTLPEILMSCILSFFLSQFIPLANPTAMLRDPGTVTWTKVG
jgi:hypothetical protein